MATLTACPSELPSFSANYGDWRGFSSPTKAGYASGAFDMLMHSGLFDAYSMADTRGVAECAVGAGFTPVILAEMIDRRYAAHKEEWSVTAANVLAAAVFEACKIQINAVRRKMGLDTLD